MDGFWNSTYITTSFLKFCSSRRLESIDRVSHDREPHGAGRIADERVAAEIHEVYVAVVGEGADWRAEQGGDLGALHGIKKIL